MRLSIRGNKMVAGFLGGFVAATLPFAMLGSSLAPPKAAHPKPLTLKTPAQLVAALGPPAGTFKGPQTLKLAAGESCGEWVASGGRVAVLVCSK